MTGPPRNSHGEGGAGAAREQKTFDISKRKEKEKEKKKSLSLAHEDAIACVPVGAVVFERFRGGKEERRRGERRGKVREEG